MGKTILLVEDEAIISLSETRELKKEGYTVINAFNGLEAVEKARTNAGNIDLILMDIDLGSGMDGTEAAREILKEQDIPVLFLSSHTEKDIVAKTEKITSYGYVVKNTGITVLAASIKMAFRLHDANKRIQEKNEELSCSKKDLMEREAQYRLLSDNMSDTVWLMDMNLKTVYISPSSLRMRGFTMEEINRMPLEAHMPPDSYRRAMDLLSEALSPENLNSPKPRVNYSIELEFYRKDGSKVWTDNAFTLIFDRGGKPADILGCGRDITERKQAEEALRESEKRVRRKLDAILSPEADIDALELSDIIDSEKLQKLMEEFYRLTNIGIGIIDLHGRVLVGTGWQDICTKFHRVNPESCRLCVESDLELSRHVPIGTFKQYRCKNNMWDIATPIMLGDKHVGNIFLGQFLFDDETPDYEVFRRQASRYGFNEREYIAALDRVPRWSRKTVDAAMSFYTVFAGMIGNLSYSNIKLANALEERKRTEDALRRLNRELRAVSNCNQTLLRAVDEQTLLNDICNIICGEAGYRTAWVGFAENDDTKTIRPVAWAGIEDGYISEAGLTWADTEHGRGPAGTAIRSGEISCIQDFTTDLEAAPWRDNASKRGFRSCVALPLKDENAQTFGVLTIYSTEPDTFTREELHLLEELADDLAFGITTLRIRGEHKRAEEELRRADRALRVLSASNQVIIRSTAEPELFREICRVIVEIGGYRLAWIGIAEQDDLKTVKPAASAGFEEGYLEQTRASWADGELGRGPMGTAIRSGRPVVCRDIASDPCFEPWRAEAAQRGYASQVALPLIIDGRVFGAIGIYAAENDAFDTGETELLKELVDDLAFGLKALRARDERLRAEDALRKSETRYRIVADNTYDWEFWMEPGRRFLYNSLSCERITGHAVEEFGKDPDLMLRILHPDDREMFLLHNYKVAEKQEQGGAVFRIVRPDGGIRWIEHLCRPVFDDNGDFMGSRGSNRDITDRKLAEDIMKARLRLLEFAGSHSMEETLTAVLDEIEALTESVIGFYHFLEPDQETLSLQNWSTNTLKTMCTAKGKGSHYNVSLAGVWVDCIHERRPVIHNDYAALPHRKGMPEGHAKVVREAVVPIIRGGLIKAIIGMGNKSADYTEDDTAVISRLGDLSWDIVELKRAENVLRESEARFRGIYENFPLGYQSLDAEGRFLDVNQAWLDTLGYAREEVIGKWFGGFIAPHEAAAFRERFHRFKAEGKAVSEFEMIRKDGSSAIFTFNGRIEYDITGRFKKTHCITADITSKKDEEAAILSAKDAWEKTFDALPIFVALIDGSHRILRINNTMAAQFGKAPSDFVGMHCYELIHGLSEPPDFCPHSCTMKDGMQHSAEIFEKRFDKWFIVNTVPLSDENGRLVSSTHVMADITERKRNEEKIVAALAEKETLLRELQHRVKNSMTLITSLIGLEGDRTADDNLRSVLDNLKRRIFSLENLYDFLYQTSDITRVSLDKYIASIVGSLAGAFVFDSSVIHIRENLQPVTVDVKNAMAWGLIVNELVTNALKYAFPKATGGSVDIELRETHNSINLAVCDNGKGLPADFAIENSSGFGMNLVNLLAEQLGGTFGFKRERRNRFEVRVPKSP